MDARIFRTFLAAAWTLSLAATAVAQTPGAPVPNVVIDGSAVTFDQPPIEQAGRIFVPLRGVFERLGASVVYQNGQINATSGSHAIGLHVGAPTATIDGQTDTLESPPMLVGGRVLVPLRFIAEALGASVNFDAASQTAYITRAATPPPATPAPTAPPPPPPARPPGAAPVVLRLLREEPANDSTLPRTRPEISASFAEPIDPNSAHVEVDGRDVTGDSYVSERAFVYDPSFDLPPGTHQVTVAGKTPAREPFEDRWTFTTGTPVARNYLSGVEPPNGLLVGSPLVVSGITRPHARIRVVATSSETVAHFSEVAGGSAATTTTADERGFFEARLELVETGGGILDVRIDSTAPDGGLAVKTLRLRI